METGLELFSFHQMTVLKWKCVAMQRSHRNGELGHYNDFIMGTITSQITSLTIVYSTVYSGTDQRKHESSALLVICAENSLGSGESPGTGEFPAQMASNVENASIWWRHHDPKFSHQQSCLCGRFWNNLFVNFSELEIAVFHQIILMFYLRQSNWLWKSGLHV